jgi:amino-acid N-acetyltransferase
MLTVRKARLTDVPALLALINDYAARGVMLQRTEFELCENLRDFTVAIESEDGEEERIAGCGALHFYTTQTAEVRSLAVAERRKTAGVGKKIVAALIEEARDFKLDIVFAFTYVVGFFEKCGFLVVDRGTLPLKAWNDCVRCPKFSCCDEIAVVYLLSPEAVAHTQRTDVKLGDLNLVEIKPLNANWSLSPEEPILMPMPAAGRGFQQR